MTLFMAKVYTTGQVETDMKEIGLSLIGQVKVCSHGQMVEDTKVTL